MNKTRRKTIKEIIEEIDYLLTRLEEVRGEEEEALWNMPESLQESEKGEIMQDAIDNMDNAFTSLEEALNELEEVLTL